MLNTIDEALDEIRRGRGVIVVDDEDRENEGDFIAAAEAVTPEMIAFMLKRTSGIICVPLTEARAAELDLPMMVEINTARHGTPFTVSVDYLHGTSTGVSAEDRSKTIRALTDSKTTARDFARPGHIFRFAPSKKACCGAPATPKLQSILHGWPGSNPSAFCAR